MLIFALMSGAIGASSLISGFLHLPLWPTHTLASATSLAIISCAFTALASGLMCKEISLGGHRGKRLQTLEVLVIISLLSQLLYVGLLHVGMFSSYGPNCQNLEELEGDIANIDLS
ncbi:membrane protein PM19L-like [Senna tora]|uniref:Membrane protein PM19L-like n=1 Tax=Senna tora TaxID=362788 RepID=A0A834SYK5_9FABA|nr:membrane protein PM19L-like [Senna tora]